MHFPLTLNVGLAGLVFVAGAVLVGRTVMSAVRNFVLPRAQRVLLSRIVFVVLRVFFMLRLRRTRDYAVRDRVLSIYAPVCLLMLALVWLLLVGAGFAAMFWAIGVRPLRDAGLVSGSSLFTLGFLRPDHGMGAGVAAGADPTLGSLLAFAEAGVGLGLLALLISYLPSIYAAFTRREVAVSLLEPLAGSPPTPVGLLLRHQNVAGLERLEDVWVRWRDWFADVEESHTSIGALAFFRSPHPDRHWTTAAGCVLDTAAITISCLDLPPELPSELVEIAADDPLEAELKAV